MGIQRKVITYTVIVLSISTILTVWGHRLEEKEGFSEYTPITPAPIAVTVCTVEKGLVSRWIVTESYVEATRKVHLQFEEAGKVVFIAKDTEGRSLHEGSKVSGPEHSDAEGNSCGQLLARLDSRDKVSEIHQREAALNESRQNLDAEREALIQAQLTQAEAQRDLERKKLLFESKSISRSHYEEAQNALKIAVAAKRLSKNHVDSAQSRVDSATEGLKIAVRDQEKTALYAPFNGIIGRINIKEGQYFDPVSVEHNNNTYHSETAPITLFDPTEMEATLYFPEFIGRKVRVGQRVVATPAIESWSPETNLQTAVKVEGTVFSVSPQIDVARRSIRVKVHLVPKAKAISDGMYVSCWIAVEQKPKAIRIPLGSLLNQGSIPYVYVEKNGTVRRNNLSLGIQDSAYVEVTQGLFPGDRVVCKGRKKLVNKATVRVLPDTVASRSDGNVR